MISVSLAETTVFQSDIIIIIFSVREKNYDCFFIDNVKKKFFFTLILIVLHIMSCCILVTYATSTYI